MNRTPTLTEGSAPLALAAAILLLTGCATTSSPSRAIHELLAAQTDAWNRGDIPAFMDYYVRGDELTFSSGGRTERGWDATLARYQRRYPTRERMGVLRFDELEVRPVAPDAALVLGRWHLTRPPDDVGGNFSLFVVRRTGRWMILHDHTSVEPAAPAAAPTQSESPQGGEAAKGDASPASSSASSAVRRPRRCARRYGIKGR